MKKKAKMVVYTAIFGNRDDLKKPKRFKGVDYVCFTDDKNLNSDVWKIKLVKKKGNPRMLAKIYKILPHKYFKDYEYSLWVDGSTIPVVNPRKLVRMFLKKRDIALFRHALRKCIYDEAKVCIAEKLDKKRIIIAQMKKYRKEGYPRKNGLASCTIILRRHNEDKIKRAMGDWWKEIKKFSSRDQLSFNYIMWKNGIKYQFIPGNVRVNLYLSHMPHLGMDDDRKIFIRWNRRLKERSRKIREQKLKGRGIYKILDRKIGKFGIAIKRASPSAYHVLKKVLPG